jgi:hypothetical protein
MQKKNEILVLVTPEHLSAVAADNGWQRHFQTAFEQVSDRRDPTNSRSSVLTAGNPLKADIVSRPSAGGA